MPARYDHPHARLDPRPLPMRRMRTTASHGPAATPLTRYMSIAWHENAHARRGAELCGQSCCSNLDVRTVGRPADFIMRPPREASADSCFSCNAGERDDRSCGAREAKPRTIPLASLHLFHPHAHSPLEHIKNIHFSASAPSQRSKVLAAGRRRQYVPPAA